jgi:hypothetical protein
MASAELQAAITLSQQVRGLHSTVEMLELLVDQLPAVAPEKLALEAKVGEVVDLVQTMTSRAEAMKVAARGYGVVSGELTVNGLARHP